MATDTQEAYGAVSKAFHRVMALLVGWRLLKVGDRITIEDAAGYTMVKKNWFNGVAMPAIVVRELDGSTRVIRSFTYDDFASSLS